MRGLLSLLLALAIIAPAEFIEPPPMAEVSMPAIATEPAVRLDPPVLEVGPPGYSRDEDGRRCIGAEDLLAYWSPGWSVERMSRIAYRESRCIPEVMNRHSSATGVLQILASHCPWLAEQMGTWCTRERLRDPVFNIKAAAVLWREQGYGAWAT